MSRVCMENGRVILETDKALTFAKCPHDHKRIARFDAHGLLVFCKVCKVEWIVSYEEITWIQQGFALREAGTR